MYSNNIWRDFFLLRQNYFIATVDDTLPPQVRHAFDHYKKLKRSSIFKEIQNNNDAVFYRMVQTSVQNLTPLNIFFKRQTSYHFKAYVFRNLSAFDFFNY